MRTIVAPAILATVILAGCAVATTGSSAPPRTAASHSSPTLATPSPRSPTPLAGTSVPSPGAALTAVGIGDSVMAGTHCGCAGPMAAYARQFSRATGRRVDARGFGANGATTASVLEQIKADPVRTALRHADIIVVIVGANDLNPDAAKRASGSCDRSCYQPDVAAMGTRLGHLLDQLARIDTTSPHMVLVTNYWDLFPEAGLARSGPESAQLEWQEAVTAAANNAIRTQVLLHGDVYVDTVVPFRGGGGADDPSPLLAADGDHPNAVGVQVLAKALVAAHPTPPGAG